MIGVARIPDVARLAVAVHLLLERGFLGDAGDAREDELPRVEQMPSRR
jgi:hypothetical protein